MPKLCHMHDEFFTQLQVDQHGRVWPCGLIMNCVRFYTLPEADIPFSTTTAIESTVELQAAIAQDPDWNNTNVRSVEEIMTHSMFVDTWSKESVETKPCALCVDRCGE